MTDLRTTVANAIRRAAFRNSHCSCVPGPYLAGIYADAAIDAMQAVDPSGDRPDD
jgi:hypothetical protein